MIMVKRTALAAPIDLFDLWPGVAAADLSVVRTGDGIDLLRALGAALNAYNPQTGMYIPPCVGSGADYRAVGHGKEIWVPVARTWSSPDQTLGLVATPILRPPAAFFVHRPAAVSGLTTQQIADIYAGKITNWHEVGGADLRIK